MSDAGRTISGFVAELFGVMGDLLAGAGTWAERTAMRYFTFLREATTVFGIVAVVLLGVLMIGAITEQQWLVSAATLFIGIASAVFLLLTLPIGAGLKLVGEFEPIKNFVRGVGSLLLWAFLLSLYFSVVPVSNRPGAIFLVILITLIVGLFWAVYGIGPNPKRIYASVISVFVITTVSFFFPKTFSNLKGGLDDLMAVKLDECLSDPFSCFSQQLGREEIVRCVEMPLSSAGSLQPGSAQEAGQPPDKHPKRGTVSLELRSDPVGAEVFLDWALKCRTPARLEGKRISGLLVVAKDDQQAWFRQINSRESDMLDLSLPLEDVRSRMRLLLSISEGGSDDAFSSLKSGLVREGFTVVGPEEAREFQRELTRAGGLSHRGLRAWARARFDTDLLVTARFLQSSRELSEQELRYLGVQGMVKNAVRAKVTVDLEVVDLRSGSHLTTAAGEGSSLALDRGEGFQKALTQAATKSAELLHQRVQG